MRNGSIYAKEECILYFQMMVEGVVWLHFYTVNTAFWLNTKDLSIVCLVVVDSNLCVCPKQVSLENETLRPDENILYK